VRQIDKPKLRHTSTLAQIQIEFFLARSTDPIFDATTIREPCQLKAAHALSRSPPKNPTTNLDLEHHHVTLTRSTFNIQRVENASQTLSTCKTKYNDQT